MCPHTAHSHAHVVRNLVRQEGAIQRLSQLAQELETELDTDRKVASDREKVWQDALDRMDSFAKNLAMLQPEIQPKNTASAVDGEGYDRDAALVLPSDGSVYGVHLHSTMRTGLLMISQDLWGTAPEQHDREMGRVASWVWGTQCMLFQVFRFYASRSSSAAGAVLGEEDWRRFVEDCRIQSAVRPSDSNDESRKSASVAVFDHLKRHEAKKPGKNRTNSPAEEYALTFFEFLMAVVELAGRVMGAELSNASDMLLSQRVSTFLEQHIAYYVPRSDSAVLAATIDSHLARQFFAERKKELRAVYAVFCKADEGQRTNLSTINQREFMELVAVCKLDKTAGLNPLRARKMFNNAVGLVRASALAEQIETTIAASPGLHVGTHELRAAPASAVAFALAGKYSSAVQCKRHGRFCMF